MQQALLFFQQDLVLRDASLRVARSNSTTFYSFPKGRRGTVSALTLSEKYQPTFMRLLVQEEVL